MKLTRVEPFVVRTEPPHWGGATWYFVRLETDDGLVGWGETAVLGAFAGLEASYASLVQQAFARYLEGADPMDREALYQKLVEGMTAQHPDYATMGVISAFDIALWDICGQTLRHAGLQPARRPRTRSGSFLYLHLRHREHR